MRKKTSITADKFNVEKFVKGHLVNILANGHCSFPGICVSRLHSLAFQQWQHSRYFLYFFSVYDILKCSCKLVDGVQLH